MHKVGSVQYCYDANGNMTKRDGSTISYSSYNLPTVINQGSNSSTLSYGAFRNRYKQVAVSAGATETTLYVAGLFEKVTLPGGVVEYRHYIPGGNDTAAIHTRRSSGTNSTYYWHADHLGSPELFTNSGGGEEVRPSFGAFGERRDGSDWLGPPSAADLAKIAGITRRGFTGHEHLDSVGLIHMNGRVYDPGIGRFLGVDPIVGVGVSQDANSYNYAWNSPLNVVDPSGLRDGVVVNCQGECFQGTLFEFLDAHGWLGFSPYDNGDPAAAGAIGSSSGVAKDRWDGKSALAGRAGPMFGLGSRSLTPLQLLVIADNAYSDPVIDLPELDPNSLGLDPELFYDRRSGFAAALFQYDGITYVSFRGTDDRSDIVADVLQSAGYFSSQYDQAVELASAVSAAVGPNLVFVGHSLGGGLAAVAAISTGNRAVTFNAAGLHANTMTNYQLKGANPRQLVTAFYLVGEALSFAQDMSKLPDAIGRRVPVLPRDLSGPLSWHSRTAFLRALGL